MNYRKDRYGNDLSILGYGCMRFPQRLGRIDMAETERLLLRAVDAGINYFDTAYIYHGGIGEVAFRKSVVERYPRDSFKISTKLPLFVITEESQLEPIFKEQLENCGVDPDEYTGFAFGMGIERIAMLKYGINNIKTLFENDTRFLEQFED